MAENFCADCAYFARSTESCDYWLIEDQLRGCPGGSGCNKKISKKEFAKMNPAGKWDKAAGKQMWLDGKSDKEIAEAFDLTRSAVSYVRKKYWEPEKKQKEQTGKPAFVPVDLKDPAWKSVPATDEQEAQEVPEASPAEGCVAGEAASEPVPNEENAPSGGGLEGPEGVGEDPDEVIAKRMITMLENMTGHLKGMDAVMTAQLVTALWNWDSLADLKAAKICLDYLIERHGG